jgi:DNA-directed RNA polymerase subunit RPC12/RpoP
MTMTATLYGCADPDCGYKTLPSTMGTPYERCPLCGGRWTSNPPIQNRDGTGDVLKDRVAGAKKWNEYVVRPHLRGLLNEPS